MALHLDRQREIAEILSRNGLSFLINSIGLHRFVPARALPWRPETEERIANPVVLRRTFEQLGTTFIKLGQMLSTRSDLLPPRYQTELAKLQDSTRPVDAPTIHRLVREELGRDPDELFARFDDEPLASASIGQAHTARLRDGTEVVVKVRREGVVEEIEQDLEILNNLTNYASRNWSFVEDYNIVGFVDEFSAALRHEVDYLHEAKNCERMAHNFAEDPGLRIPAISWQHTTSRVLTQERMTGVKITDTVRLDEAGIDRGRLAHDAATRVLDMVFRDGFFHADPHPGNMFVERGGRIALIDFGMMGEIDDRLRNRLGQLFVALSIENTERITTLLLQIAPPKGRVSRSRIAQAVNRVVRDLQDKPLEEISVADVSGEILAVLRHNKLQLPQELSLMIRMLAMVEGMGRVLEPGFTLSSVIRPYGRRLVLERLRPKNLARTAARHGLEAVELGSALPERLLQTLDAYEQDGIEVRVNGDDLDPYMRRAERVGSRIIAGIVLTAMLNMVADVATSEREDRFTTALTIGGSVASGAIAGYLGLTGLPRRRRRRRR